jgi:ring-1,2-phenylacetyl-CoA epoxidase subunit PaaE
VSTLHFHPLTVAEVRREGDEALAVRFEVPPALHPTFGRFEPGQYLTLRRPGREPRRSYSICAAAGEAPRVGIRRVPGGEFSPWLHEHLSPGDVLESLPPQGRFGAAARARADAPAGAPRHLLLLAAGSGITPVLSIARTVLRTEPATRVTLLYGNRTAASTMFREELEDLKNRHLARFVLHPVFSREAREVPLYAGRLDGERIAAFFAAGLVAARGVSEAFVCGPFAFNDEAEAALLHAGVPRERVHVERFGVPPSAADATLHAAREGDAGAARIVIVRDGLAREITFTASDPSVLDAAARAGLDVPYSCKSGVCATCRARVLEGRVRMDRNFALEPDELARGFVLTCQSHPLTERVVVSFDER